MAHQKNHKKRLGRRCEEMKCAKLAEDCIDGEYLCRIHSPMREGFEKRLKLEKKK